MRRYGDKASQKDGREGAEAPGRDHAAQVPGKKIKEGKDKEAAEEEMEERGTKGQCAWRE